MSTLPHFSHLYIEDAAGEYSLTRELIDRFPKAVLVSINNYKEIFNRPRQRWDHQRESLKLILAVRRDNFLYPGSSFVPAFDHNRFFYTTPILNCLYGCEYCYLQGLLPSANMVVFVNADDFTQNAERELSGDTPAYLCVSYDTDLLAIEDLFHYCAHWVEFARTNPHVTVEIRTKSANMRALSEISPTQNAILAWTLSPEDVIARFEHKTPSLKARLKAVAEAQDLGWTVRLCLDPILRVNNWQQHYQELVHHIFSRIQSDKICDVSLGVFRINSGYLRTMQDQRPQSKIITYPYNVENGAASYAPTERRELLEFVAHHLRQFISEEKICLVPWQS